MKKSESDFQSGKSTLGAVLRDAREHKGVSASQAALSTRIKVQHIEAMEREEFDLIAAPAYAKGFIKLYAEYLGLDPEPLLQSYNEFYAPTERAPLYVEDDFKKPSRAQARSESVKTKALGLALQKFFQSILSWVKRNKRFIMAAVLLVLIVVSLVRCGKSALKATSEESGKPNVATQAPTGPLMQEPPLPYMDVPEPGSVPRPPADR